LKVTAANEQDRAQVAEMAARVQEVTGETVEITYVDQGYTGAGAAAQAEAQGIRLEVVKHHEAKNGFVLLPRRWVVARSFGWRATTNDWQKPWPAGIGSPFLLSYSADYLLKVHNRL